MLPAVPMGERAPCPRALRRSRNMLLLQKCDEHPITSSDMLNPLDPGMLCRRRCVRARLVISEVSRLDTSLYGETLGEHCSCAYDDLAIA